MNKVLVVCAHPDDEVLGLGGALLRHIDNGDEVYVLVYTDGHKSRGTNDFTTRHQEFENCMGMLGVTKYWLLEYDDQKLDQYPLIELTVELEKVLKVVQPNVLYTHSEYDLNLDHRVVSQAAITAARPLPNSSIDLVLKFETPSATEWSFNHFNYNKPNYFIDISDCFEHKIKLIGNYESELKDANHPRSVENISSVASMHGATVGVNYAECFHLHYSRR